MQNQSIPKIAHLSWKAKDIADNQSPVILNGLRNLIDMNPDWKVTVYDDQEVDAYLKKLLNPVDYQLISPKKIVEKTDLWRLLKIYYEGGLYMDLDRYYNIPLDQVIGPNVKWVLPTYHDMDFSQDIMLSAPGNPVFQEAINLNLQRRREGCNNLYHLGAPTYMHAITKVLFGVMIDREPGVEHFNDMRRKLAEIPFISSYRENPPYDTVVFKYDEKTFKKGNGKNKQEFYDEFDVSHWTGQRVE